MGCAQNSAAGHSFARDSLAPTLPCPLLSSVVPRRPGRTRKWRFLEPVWPLSYPIPHTPPAGPVLVLNPAHAISSETSHQPLAFEYPILRMNNITYEGAWDFRDIKYIDVPDKDLPKYLVQNGDIQKGALPMPGMQTKSIKSAARELVDSLPDDVTWDDVMYRVYVRQAIDAGRQDAAEGRLVDVAEVRRQFGLPE
jgi:hypothetical protein